MEQELKNEAEVAATEVVISEGAENPKEAVECVESVEAPKESDNDDVKDGENEVPPAEEPAKEEKNGVSEKNGSTISETPKENGEKNGFSKENEDGDLKRKSGTADIPELEVSAEKKAKLAEDLDAVAEAENGVETN